MVQRNRCEQAASQTGLVDCCHARIARASGTVHRSIRQRGYKKLKTLNITRCFQQLCATLKRSVALTSTSTSRCAPPRRSFALIHKSNTCHQTNHCEGTRRLPTSAGLALPWQSLASSAANSESRTMRDSKAIVSGFLQGYANSTSFATWYKALGSTADPRSWRVSSNSM